MPDSEPAAPDSVPDELVAMLGDCSQELLRAIARYATDLAAYRERVARLEERESRVDQPEVVPEALPEVVPSKASLTIEEIHDNRYYWQWRDRDEIRSKYHRPVDPDG